MIFWRFQLRRHADQICRLQCIKSIASVGYEKKWVMKFRKSATSGIIRRKCFVELLQRIGILETDFALFFDILIPAPIKTAQELLLRR